MEYRALLTGIEEIVPHPLSVATTYNDPDAIHNGNSIINLGPIYEVCACPCVCTCACACASALLACVFILCVFVCCMCVAYVSRICA